MSTVRAYLEAIANRSHEYPSSPRDFLNAQDAHQALAILGRDHRYRCGPGCWDCDIQRTPWRSTNVRVSIVPDPEETT